VWWSQLAALKAFLMLEVALTKAPVLDAGFTLAQFGASMVAMTSNYLINNEITYRDRRRRGLKLLLGYLKFCALCSVGPGRQSGGRPPRSISLCRSGGWPGPPARASGRCGTM